MFTYILLSVISHVPIVLTLEWVGGVDHREDLGIKLGVPVILVVPHLNLLFSFVHCQFCLRKLQLVKETNYASLVLNFWHFMYLSFVIARRNVTNCGVWTFGCDHGQLLLTCRHEKIHLSFGIWTDSNLRINEMDSIGCTWSIVHIKEFSCGWRQRCLSLNHIPEQAQDCKSFWKHILFNIIIISI